MLPPPATAPAATASDPDRYELAGGCYTLHSQEPSGQVAQRGGGYRASPGDPEPARFRMQATDLGSYLL